MSLLNDLRRLLFGAKAVTKHSAEKAGETIQEKVRETKEDLESWMEKMRKESGVEPPEAAQTPPPPHQDEPDFLSQTGHQIKETGEAILHKAGEVAEKTGSAILEKGKKVEQALESIGEQVLQAGENLAEKAGDIAEKVGGEVMEKGGAVLGNARDIIVETGKKIGEEAGKLFDKAQEEAAREAAEKAAEKAEQEARAAKFRTDSPVGKDHKSALDDSMLGNTGGFFEKAEQFSKGNYHHGEIQIEPGEKTERPKPEGATAGFEDLDGDGDDIIDEAQIIESDDPPQV